MIISKNNIIVKIDKLNPVEYAILNPISGSFDMMNESEYDVYKHAELGEVIDKKIEDYFLERGYFYRSKESWEKAQNIAYEEFQQEIANTQTQLMLIPTYSCNLDCTYCYQHGIDGRPNLITKETVDAFFEYAEKEYINATVKPFITLFGGEPLMNSKGQREIIEYIVNKSIEEDYELSFVTNGYDFVEFADMLKKAKIKEIQFTLDGSKEIHDVRRMTGNKNGTFDRILLGMEKAVEYKFPINLRSVVDKENVENLVALAEYMDGRGWLDLPLELFKTGIGRNYELFECYEKPEHLFSQVELWSYIAKLAEKYPVMKKYHRPDFMGIRYLVETGDLFLASYDTCPAGKSEFVFDLHGDIYGCTASCGREDFKLGTYWPIVEKNNTAIESWKNRNVTNIEKCRNCKYDVICGGGCGVVAANKNNGEILSPDCRPIQELYDIGLNFYIEDIKKLIEPGAEDEEKKNIIKDENPNKVQNGCLICGSSLVYNDKSEKVKCDICGKLFSSNIKCVKGHFICDHCHNGDVLEHMEDLLVESTEHNPIRLAEMVFNMPTMKMHGPEHHSMVPAVLETAHQNILGIRDIKKIEETINRGKDIKGGSCGFHGNCGACVGTGIAESVYLDASPNSKEARGRAMLATGTALLEVSKLGGPLCCKRDSITSIEAYMNMSDRYKDVNEYKYICSHSKYNKGCLTLDCPYFPGSINNLG
ncbi:MAG: radical SAM protein [Peptostreptococcaceae bacterium]|nr:radical SAM protein [Peptostreptococcaceae bacterium]